MTLRTHRSLNAEKHSILRGRPKGIVPAAAVVRRDPGKTDGNPIHVILDNYAIHTTEQVEVSLQTGEGGRLRLHFLPPYCPDHNKIERTWQDLHAAVTRNHTRTTMNDLMQDVRTYLRRRNHQYQTTTAA